MVTFPVPSIPCVPGVCVSLSLSVRKRAESKSRHCQRGGRQFNLGGNETSPTVEEEQRTETTIQSSHNFPLLLFTALVPSNNGCLRRTFFFGTKV